MSSGDKMFENLLYGMTILLGLVVLINLEALILFMIWFLILGALQVLHSLAIAISYWKNEKIRKGIIIYWILAGLNLLLLFWDGPGIITDDMFHFGFVVLFFIMPFSLATYLWWFTLHFRKQQLIAEEAQANVDQFEQQQNHVA